MKSYGVKTAYNLDGGGSSTLYFNGKVVNKPTTNGTISERAVVTLFTLVTKTNNKRFKKTAVVYTLITVFFFIFSRIYEHFSFGETSVYMHWVFGVPLIGGLCSLFSKLIPNLSRLSLNLWNSAVATICRWRSFRGIVNLSGRSTTLDLPYWYVGIGLAWLALLSMIFTRSVWEIDIQDTKKY